MNMLRFWIYFALILLVQSKRCNVIDTEEKCTIECECRWCNKCVSNDVIGHECKNQTVSTRLFRCKSPSWATVILCMILVGVVLTSIMTLLCFGGCTYLIEVLKRYFSSRSILKNYYEI